ARDREDPRLLSQQPGDGELRGRHLLPIRDLAKQINEGLVRLPGLHREAGNSVAEVGADERRAFGDRAGEEALAEGAERHEPDPELLERWQDLFLRTSPPQRILALNRSDGLDCVSTPDRLHA